MLHALLVSVFAAALTVAEGGVVLQPALSPDGTRIAFASDENGEVAIYVAPVAAGAERTRVAVVGTGADAQRLAVHALMHRPWSDDSKQLIFMSPSATAEVLYAVVADGAAEPRLIGPQEGVVDNASWLRGNNVAFTWRENKQERVSEVSESEQLYVIDATTGFNSDVIVKDFFKESFAADLAPSPDGRWLATMQLSGPRDERRRTVRIFDQQTARPWVLNDADRANFLTWTVDSKRLYYVNTQSHDVSFWLINEGAQRDAKIGDVAAAVAIPGALLAMDTRGVLTARDLETGKASKDLARDFVPVSAAGTKVALLRRGAAGPAIVVCDVTPAAIEAGDIGLPGGAGGGAPGSAPGGSTPGNGGKPSTNGESGSRAPDPPGTSVPAKAPPG
jgi:hypothetical protein